jgi:hypothetical protein
MGASYESRIILRSSLKVYAEIDFGFLDAVDLLTEGPPSVAGSKTFRNKRYTLVNISICV